MQCVAKSRRPSNNDKQRFFFSFKTCNARNVVSDLNTRLCPFYAALGFIRPRKWRAINFGLRSIVLHVTHAQWSYCVLREEPLKTMVVSFIRFQKKNTVNTRMVQCTFCRTQQRHTGVVQMRSPLWLWSEYGKRHTTYAVYQPTSYHSPDPFFWIDIVISELVYGYN